MEGMLNPTFWTNDDEGLAERVWKPLGRLKEQALHRRLKAMQDMGGVAIASFTPPLPSAPIPFPPHLDPPRTLEYKLDAQDLAAEEVQFDWVC